MISDPLLLLATDYDPGTKSWRWEIDFNELKIDKPVGHGHFSICFKGTLHGTPVAVKVTWFYLPSASVILIRVNAAIEDCKADRASDSVIQSRSWTHE